MRPDPNNVFSVAVMQDDIEIERVDREAVEIGGIPFVVYGCKFYELQGWAMWERYIEITQWWDYDFVKECKLTYVS